MKAPKRYIVFIIVLAVFLSVMPVFHLHITKRVQAATYRCWGETLKPIKRSQIIANAKAYLSVKWYMLKSSYYGYKVSDKSKWKLPSWLKSIGPNHWVTGVPYNWGGADSVDTFLNKVKKGYAAGNVHAYRTHGYIGGTAGVDCSGYASRVLGWKTCRLSTTGFYNSNAFKKISFRELKPGDFLVYPGHHIMIYAGRDKDGNYYLYEATVSAGKVIYNKRSRSYVEKYYTPIRYKLVIEDLENPLSLSVDVDTYIYDNSVPIKIFVSGGVAPYTVDVSLGKYVKRITMDKAGSRFISMDVKSITESALKVVVKDKAGKTKSFIKTIYVVHDDLHDTLAYPGYGTVYDIAQYNGKVYFASSGGTYYIDGKYVKKLLDSASYDVDVIGDRLLIASSSGVYLYKNGKLYKKYGIVARTVASDGLHVYVGSYSNGFYVDGKKVTSCPTHIWDIEVKQGKVYVATDGYGAKIFEKGQCKSIGSLSGYSAYVKDISVTDNGIYIATSGGLYVWKEDKWNNLYYHKIFRRFDGVWGVSSDSSIGGVYMVKNGLPVRIASDKAYSYFFDGTSLWYGTTSQVKVIKNIVKEPLSAKLIAPIRNEEIDASNGYIPVTIEFAGGFSPYIVNVKYKNYEYAWKFDSAGKYTVKLKIANTEDSKGTLVVSVKDAFNEQRYFRRAITVFSVKPLKASIVAPTDTAEVSNGMLPVTLSISGGKAPYRVSVSLGDNIRMSREFSEEQTYVVLLPITQQIYQGALNVKVSDATGQVVELNRDIDIFYVKDLQTTYVFDIGSDIYEIIPYNGGYAIGTKDGGVYFYKDGKVSKVGWTLTGAYGVVVYNGNLYATGKWGVYKSTGRGWTRVFEQADIRDITFVGRTVAVSYTKGAWEKVGNSWKQLKGCPSKLWAVTSIGGNIYMASDGQGVWYYDGNLCKNYTFNLSGNARYVKDVRAAYIGGKPYVYVATADGVYYLSEHRWIKLLPFAGVFRDIHSTILSGFSGVFAKINGLWYKIAVGVSHASYKDEKYIIYGIGSKLYVVNK